VFYLYGPHDLFTSVVIRNATLLFIFCVCETQFRRVWGYLHFAIGKAVHSPKRMHF